LFLTITTSTITWSTTITISTFTI